MALPPGVSGKTLTFGTTTGFDGVTVPDGSRVTITTSKNVKHVTSGRQLVAGQIVRKYVSGIATFDELVPNDAPGLDRYDWTYTVRFEIAGANESPSSFSFALFNSDPQTIDGDLLSPVPSSIGSPVFVSVPTSVAGYTGTVTGAQIAADPALTAAFDAYGAASTARSFAVQRANHTGTQPAASITGLAAIATSGAYADLTGKPAIPAAVSLTDNGTYATLTVG